MFALLRGLRALFGYNRYSAKTLDRLLYSSHVDDLRVVARVSSYAAFLAIVYLLVVYNAFDVSRSLAEYWGIGRSLPTWEVPAKEALVPIGGAIFAALGGIIAWCYKTGSSRLGMVDLFACEITTLCRI